MKYLLTFLGAFAGIWVINSLLSGHEISYFSWDKLAMRLAIAFIITILIWRKKTTA